MKKKTDIKGISQTRNGKIVKLGEFRMGSFVKIDFSILRPYNSCWSVLRKQADMLKNTLNFHLLFAYSVAVDEPSTHSEIYML